MLHIVLFQPDIPQNTGSIGRMCALTGSRLHLIHPLGFQLSDKYLRRAGMDYWRHIDLYEHTDWDTFAASPDGPKRLWLLSTKATTSFWDTSFADEDGLLFGKETAGFPQWLRDQVGAQQSLTIPQFNPALRSLNLATSAGIVTYEAIRQLGHGAGVRHL